MLRHTEGYKPQVNENKGHCRGIDVVDGVNLEPKDSFEYEYKNKIIPKSGFYEN